MPQDFKLLMISAMYENGGNATHRLLDGHPQLLVYPFESQLGTRLVSDALSSVFPQKYRWPRFALGASAAEDYEAIIDEECKVRSRTAQVSKFRHTDFDFSDDERRRFFERYAGDSPRSTAAIVAAYFRATFDAWKNYHRTAEPSVYVGYSPIVIVDAARILHDLPQAHVLHVVRNPWSAYADTRKRPVPLSMEAYMLGWTLCQYYALYYREKYPQRVFIARLEDIVEDPCRALDPLLSALNLASHDALRTPTWNGQALPEVYPWGTLRQVTPQANRTTAAELTDDEAAEVSRLCWQYLDVFGYRGFR